MEKGNHMMVKSEKNTQQSKRHPHKTVREAFKIRPTKTNKNKIEVFLQKMWWEEHQVSGNLICTISAGGRNVQTISLVFPK